MITPNVATPIPPMACQCIPGMALTGLLLDNPYMFGYCYTQLTDVSVEQNGIYTFDRRAKFDLERLHQIQCRPAAFEQC